jgi:hypothetical protein
VLRPMGELEGVFCFGGPRLIALACFAGGNPNCPGRDPGHKSSHPHLSKHKVQKNRSKMDYVMKVRD